MDKREFLEKLTHALAGQVPNSIIEENIRYYKDYLDEQTKNGKTTAQVLEELGDPRLIARSIIEANGGEVSGFSEDSDTDQSSLYQREEDFRRDGGFKTFHFNGFWAVLLLIGILFLVLMVVGTLIGGIFLLLRPIIIPLFIIWLVYWVIWKRKWR